MRTWHRPLLVLTALMTGTAVVSAIGLLVDDRVLLGAPIWLKPLKFSVSLAVYGATWAWLLSLHPRPPRLLTRVATGIVVLALVEMVLITGQVVRGVASHFNATTRFDGVVFNVMGFAIVAIWVGTLLLTIKLAAQALAPPAELTAIRWGMVLSLIGMLLAVLMVERPTGITGVVGAHSVGVPDGGPGMPVTGWSSTGGDLRVPHFIGMHALQVLPLLALLVRRSPAATRLVRVFGAAYAGLIALVTWQAVRGQSIIHPDWQTGTAFGVLVVLTAAGVLHANTEKVAA